MKRDDTEIKAKHLRRLISVKNLMEYDGRLLSRSEAEVIEDFGLAFRTFH